MRVRVRISARTRTRGRRMLFDHAQRVTPYVAVERDGLTLLVATWDKGLGRKLFAHRRRKEMRVLARVVATLEGRGVELRGSTLVDVGANIGTTSLPALAWHGFGKVVAIEPDPQNARVLRSSAALNGLEDRLSVVDAAAGAEVGHTTLVHSNRNSGAHRVARSDETGEVVPLTTLDALVTEGVIDPAEVGLVWIDAQGAEADVLAGAQSLIARRIPLVLELGMGVPVDLGAYREWADLHPKRIQLEPLPVRQGPHRFLDVLVL